jgi:hypothetical protein
MDNNSECRKMIMSIYEGINSLEEHEFKPWNTELQNKVFEYLQELTGSNPGAAYNAISQTKSESPSKESLRPKNKTKEIETEFSMDSAMSDATKGSDGEIEDWLKEFDIK